MILNDPKSIQLIEVVEFGAQYKPGKKWLPLVLIALALLGKYID